MAFLGSPLPRAAAANTWLPIQWNGEDALASSSGDWKAIVSLPRARLVHFGPANRDLNLLFATSTRDHPAGWAGLRLWLGPQKAWAVIWPPPAVWEHGAAARVTEVDGRLELALASAGDGWPDLTRTYAWDGPRLVCGAVLHGGTRDAQVIHIVQVPQRAVISAKATAEREYLAGYVRLPSAVSPFTATFAALEHVTRHGNDLELRHLLRTEKLGFRPQPLAAHLDGYTLHVARGPELGRRVADPDEGFHTQVYLGRADEPFIELEQLTSTWSPDTPASAAIILSADRP